MQALKELLTAILHRCGSLPRTNLVKLVYLVDWEYAKRYGNTYTGLSYQFHHYGPFSQTIVDVASNLSEGFLMIPIHTSKGRTSYLHGLVDPCLAEWVCLNDRVWYVLDRVLERTPYDDLEGLLEYVYSTDPMRDARRGEVLDMTKGQEATARERLRRLRERAATRRQYFAGQSDGEERMREMDEIARQIMPYQVLPGGTSEE